MNRFGLLGSRNFAPLFWTQFLAAFNDNFLKNTLVFLILATMATNPDMAASTVTLAGAVFIAPFFLLSGLGGQLADKFDKAVLARRLKLAEIGAAAVAVLGMWMQDVTTLMVALFLFGVGSALFGPLKYGILPDHLPTDRLPQANAWIEAATFSAILGGTVLAGLAFSWGGASISLFGPLMIGLAVLCYLFSRNIPETGSKAPYIKVDANVLASTWYIFSWLKADKALFAAAMFAGFFWMAGTVVLSVIPSAITSLGGEEIWITVCLTLFAVAVAAGSAFAAWISGGRPILLLSVVGTMLVGVFSLWLGFLMHSAASHIGPISGNPQLLWIAAALSGIAFSGALIVVPAFAALQAWAKEESRARAVAGANIISAALMALSGAAIAILQVVGNGPDVIMYILAAVSAASSGAMIRWFPTSIFRDFVYLAFRLVHRVEIKGEEHLQDAGATPLIALNHVSFLDGPLALALTDRDPVFAINAEVAKKWWVKPFLKLTNAMPLDPSKPMATRSLIRAIEAGDPVVIFPEGRITVTGSLMKVYDGAAMVADKTGSLVVPVKIDGLERSFFSKMTDKAVRRRLFPKVVVTIAAPRELRVDEDLKGKARRQAAGAALYGIMSDLIFTTASRDVTVLQAVMNAADRYGGGRLAIEDPVTGGLSYSKLLTGARVLGKKLQALTEGETNVGVMLPNANGAAVTILGLMSAGKVPAMVNFTAGSASVLSCLKAAEIRTIFTSRAFIKIAKLESLLEEVVPVCKVIYLDDVRETITTAEKLKGLVLRKKPIVLTDAEKPAVILFTSGSEGEPKGVVLTHKNVLANASQAAARIDFGIQDKVFNVLPVFHSFGLTAGTVLPLVSGVPVFMYPSPLHYRIIPELIYGSNSTIIFGTDTFLNGYARTAHPYDFRSVRYCFAGAEPVKDSTRKVFMEKFGLRVLEGYGVTEAAPVVSINTPMFNKAGTVGKLMPGVEARLEDVPGVDEGGRLHIRGPNVMSGYLRSTNPGVLEVLEDGWHDTGDIVTIDEAGFVAIKGRAKRFAKVGGEMVSLAAVEACAGEMWPGVLSAVAAVPDPRKGERLIMLTEQEDASKSDFIKFARSQGLPEFAMPSEIVIGKVPVLGAGKVDFVGAKKFLLPT